MAGESNVTTEISESEPIWQSISFAALLTVCCCPVGLAVVCVNPRLSPRTKAVWIGGACVLFLSMLTIGRMGIARARAEMTTAHQLWSKGDKPPAIATYRKLIAHHLHAIPDADRPIVLGRVIDFDADSGDEKSVLSLLNLADKEKIIPAITSQNGLAIQSKRASSKNSSSAPVPGQQTPQSSDPASKETFVKPLILDAAQVEDLIDHPHKYAGKTLSLRARWHARDALRQGKDGSYFPFRIGGEAGGPSGRNYASKVVLIRIASDDVLAEFKSLEDLPSVGDIDEVTVTILFDGDFRKCRLLTMKRR